MCVSEEKKKDINIKKGKIYVLGVEIGFKFADKIKEK